MNKRSNNTYSEKEHCVKKYTFWHSAKNTIFSGYAVCFTLHSRFFHAHQKVYILIQTVYFICFGLGINCGGFVTDSAEIVRLFREEARSKPAVYQTNKNSGGRYNEQENIKRIIDLVYAFNHGASNSAGRRCCWGRAS